MQIKTWLDTFNSYQSLPEVAHPTVLQYFFSPKKFPAHLSTPRGRDFNGMDCTDMVVADCYGWKQIYIWNRYGSCLSFWMETDMKQIWLLQIVLDEEKKHSENVSILRWLAKLADHLEGWETSTQGTGAHRGRMRTLWVELPNARGSKIYRRTLRYIVEERHLYGNSTVE